MQHGHGGKGEGSKERDEIFYDNDVISDGDGHGNSDDDGESAMISLVHKITGKVDWDSIVQLSKRHTPSE